MSPYMRPNTLEIPLSMRLPHYHTPLFSCGRSRNLDTQAREACGPGTGRAWAGGELVPPLKAIRYLSGRHERQRSGMFGGSGGGKTISPACRYQDKIVSQWCWKAEPPEKAHGRGGEGALRTRHWQKAKLVTVFVILDGTWSHNGHPLLPPEL